MRMNLIQNETQNITRSPVNAVLPVAPDTELLCFGNSVGPQEEECTPQPSVIPETDTAMSEEAFTECQNEMFERLSKLPNIVVRSQQRDEPDLTAEQKLGNLKTIFRSNPEQFLIRFGNQVLPNELKCFDELERVGSYEARFHLKEMEKLHQIGSQTKRLKNRRYEALKKLVETSDYFSEEEMQRRNPILFDQLIGRYHTDEEREAFLQQSWKSSSGSGTTSMPLTDLFLAHLERTSEGESCRRMAQESQQDQEDEADAEYDSIDSDYDMESPRPSTSKNSKKSPRRPTVNDDQPREEIDDEEKELLKEEFFTTMYRNFLNGKDEDFDYSTVDDNPDYDCGENLENDAEDKYFDDEEPCSVSDPCSDQDELFRPPVRSSEIESKIGSLSVDNGVCDSGTNSGATVATTQDMTVGDDDEDELDVYMRELQKQL